MRRRAAIFNSSFFAQNNSVFTVPSGMPSMVATSS
jgi:hypothetical protein